MMITASPRACDSPAVTANWCPKFRERYTTRTLASSPCSARSSSGVASRLPSSTYTISQAGDTSARTPLTR
jgi:hypothetical protein